MQNGYVEQGRMDKVAITGARNDNINNCHCQLHNKQEEQYKKDIEAKKAEK